MDRVERDAETNIEKEKKINKTISRTGESEKNRKSVENGRESFPNKSPRRSSSSSSFCDRARCERE